MTDSLTRATHILIPGAWNEWCRATKLADLGLHTESGLRLGRAVEAALYGVAAELPLNIRDVEISEIRNLINSLNSAESKILRTHSDEDVRALSNISKKLSEAIARLAESSNLRCGVAGGEPRRTEALFREILQSPLANRIQIDMASRQSLLRDIVPVRNRAAHADIDGRENEISEEEHREITGKACEFIRDMVRIVISHRAEVAAQDSN